MLNSLCSIGQTRTYHLTAYWPLHGAIGNPSQFSIATATIEATSKIDAINQFMKSDYAAADGEAEIFLPTRAIVRIDVKEITE